VAAVCTRRRLDGIFGCTRCAPLSQNEVDVKTTALVQDFSVALHRGVQRVTRSWRRTGPFFRNSVQNKMLPSPSDPS